jgi:hypothetical protein
MARFCPARIHLHDIFEKTSSDNGTTFGAPINLSNNPRFSEHPQIAAYDNKAYAVYGQMTHLAIEMFFLRGAWRMVLTPLQGTKKVVLILRESRT